MCEKPQVVLLTMFFMILLSFSGVVKAFAYGSCDYSRGAYGSDCVEEIIDDNPTDNIGGTGTEDGTTGDDYTTDADTGDVEDDLTTDDEEGQIYYILRILDKNGNPVSGIRVIIEELGIDKTTDDDGYVDIGNVVDGDYKVKLSKGGQEWEKTITLGSEEIINITLDDIKGGGFNLAKICCFSFIALLGGTGVLWWFMNREEKVRAISNRERINAKVLT